MMRALILACLFMTTAAANAADGTPIPETARAMSRQVFLMSRISFALSFPLLFLMAAASHYPMFGK